MSLCRDKACLVSTGALTAAELASVTEMVPVTRKPHNQSPDIERDARCAREIPTGVLYEYESLFQTHTALKKMGEKLIMRCPTKRENIMHYTGQVYRHPMEGFTPLLEVTIGCSHNTCAFCTMYRDTPFALSKREDIIADLEELKDANPSLKRLCLVNADPFVLTMKHLIDIGELIISYFPKIEVVSGYASIRNFRNKSLEDLKKLKELRFDEFHIGLESAYDPALKQMNKGFDAAMARRQLGKIKEAGLKYDAHVVLGLAGKGNGDIHIKETVALLNEIQPYMVSIMPVSAVPGSQLEAMQKRGEYEPPTEREMLEEEKVLLRSLNLEKAYVFGSHPYNLVHFSGDLNSQREEMIAAIDQALEEMDSSILDSVKFRGNI